MVVLVSFKKSYKFVRYLHEFQIPYCGSWSIAILVNTLAITPKTLTKSSMFIGYVGLLLH